MTYRNRTVTENETKEAEMNLELKNEVESFLKKMRAFYIGLHGELLRDKKIHGRRYRPFRLEALGRQLQGILSDCDVAVRAFGEDDLSVVIDFFEDMGAVRDPFRPKFVESYMKDAWHPTRVAENDTEATLNLMRYLEMTLRESIEIKET